MDALTDCIEWPKGRTGAGYGAVMLGGKQRLAHRVAYCNANRVTLDSIEGQIVRHKCDNPPCVNPEHLELGTHKDNTQDCLRRGRGNRPSKEQHCHAKLDEATVAAMRLRYVPRCPVNGVRAMAREFGVGHTVVSRALRGIAWIV